MVGIEESETKSSADGSMLKPDMSPEEMQELVKQLETQIFENQQQDHDKLMDKRNHKHVDETDGRIHYDNIDLMDEHDDEDPLEWIPELIEWIQEAAIPLLLGIVVALVMANTMEEDYQYYFGGKSCKDWELTDKSGDGDGHRMLAALKCPRWIFAECGILGHPVTLHFIANDLIMVGHFALAMKEITESLLPGGSLNPPTKALNPLITTVGCITGPIAIFFVLLKLFWQAGLFDDDIAAGIPYSELQKGWGVVVSTDLLLGWLIGRVVFGDGHPAIDYLLLLDVTNDVFSMIIIAIAYPDPSHPFHGEYLLYSIAGMFASYVMRKWHFRKPRVEHQAWLPYVLVGGALSWIGFIKAGLHPALCMVPIVPFMPGPDMSALENLDLHLEHELMDEATDGHTDALAAVATGATHHHHHFGLDHAHHLDEAGDASRKHQEEVAEYKFNMASLQERKKQAIFTEDFVAAGIIKGEIDELMLHNPGPPPTASTTTSSIDFDFKTGGIIHTQINANDKKGSGELPTDGLTPNMGDIVKEHREFARGRGIAIQAGLFSGLVNHGVDDALKVIEFDEAGNETLNTSTLDQFEHTITIYVDTALGLFTLCNAGVVLDHFGATAALILLSLLIGKPIGVLLFYKIANHLGFPAPLGVRAHHVRMIGLMGSLGLTVALFVCDIAYEDEKIKGDAKLGSLLSGLGVFLCWAISLFTNYKDENIKDVARAQLEEELRDAVDHADKMKLKAANLR